MLSAQSGAVHYCEAAFVYLIFSTVLTQLQGMLEKKLGKHLVDTRA